MQRKIAKSLRLLRLYLAILFVLFKRSACAVTSLYCSIRDMVRHTPPKIVSAKSPFSDVWTRVVFIQFVDVHQHRRQIQFLRCRHRQQSLYFLCFHLLANTTPCTDENLKTKDGTDEVATLLSTAAMEEEYLATVLAHVDILYKNARAHTPKNGHFTETFFGWVRSTTP